MEYLWNMMGCNGHIHSRDFHDDGDITWISLDIPSGKRLHNY